jgi:hypothetical protein
LQLKIEGVFPGLNVPEKNTVVDNDRLGRLFRLAMQSTVLKQFRDRYEKA